MILLYVFMLIVGIGFVIWGAKIWRTNSVRENIWDSILSLIIGAFDSSVLGMLLFGLLLIFLSLMKLIYGVNWGIDQ
ncbi:hypothetical protein [Desulfosporosinus sp. BICA1-9]|uniref:hypothetical protein n=1 Tax=Desulfosporosinus sp. BICA1-9 TaxID=1531958 RepID=UPI00054B6AFF|nr:hypothetical protein [Desulfosporosinus sp. BICA1-9]KJS49143.1 MAG: hypothetical protein VR66_10145 [Peptococcaceae bacterium BRH_c23]KJS88683.1 MAG: hypothetical protein JL57_11000 [Desulfosporosinus sp. BICA1-9]HBW36509.1 hypothetical protein [Desulfosporosinus sp.]